MNKQPTNTQTTVKVETHGDDQVLVFPDQLLNRLGWKLGDDLMFEPQPDGSFMIKKIKYESVELDLPEHELNQLMMMAHEQHITFDQLIQNMLSEYIENQHESNQ